MEHCKCEVEREEVKLRLLEQAGKSRHNRLQGESMANRVQGCRKAVSDNDPLLLFATLFFRSPFLSLSFFLSRVSVIVYVQPGRDVTLVKFCVDCEKDEPLLLATIWSSIKRRVTISPFEGIFFFPLYCSVSSRRLTNERIGNVEHSLLWASHGHYRAYKVQTRLANIEVSHNLHGPPRGRGSGTDRRLASPCFDTASHAFQAELWMLFSHSFLAQRPDRAVTSNWRFGDVQEHVVGFQPLRAFVSFCFARLEITIHSYARYR